MKIYSHPLFHAQGRDFPGLENRDRFFRLRRMVEEAERVFSKGDEENADLRERIESVHTYVDDVRMSGPEIEAIDHEKETFIDRLSYRTACAAAATSIHAARAEGFALVRPPGHHAHREYTHGFCLLNNMALAVHALEEDGERILVLDLDVHHGCGTEELLDGKKDVAMISIYKKDLWPGDKHLRYAENCTHISLDGKVQDDRYIHVFESEVMPKIDSFNPTIIGVSLGLDTFLEEGFGFDLTSRSITKIRELLKGKKIFGILEGGYTHPSLKNGIEAFLEDP